MKKILIISPYFAPENVVASIRFTKFAKYFKRMGYYVSVICVPNLVESKTDTILEEDSKEIDQIYRVNSVSFNRKIKGLYNKVENRNNHKKNNLESKQGYQKTKRGTTLFDRIIKSKFYNIFLEAYVYYMEILLGRAIINYIKKSDMGYYDYVISTYGPLSSHLAGNYLKKTGKCGKWITDYRDVVSDVNSIGKIIPQKRRKQLAKAFVSSDIRIVLVEEMLNTLNRYALEFYKMSIQENLLYIPNGYDPDDAKYLSCENTTDCLQFAYCGIVYSKGEKLLRNPEPLFKAIQQLASKNKIDLKKIKVHYAGKNGRDFLRIASKYHLEHIIIDHGFVERIESLNIQKNSDIILSLSWNTKEDKGIMTGKIYETFIVERNVLCLISGDEPNSDLGKMVQDLNVGYVWEEGSGDGIEGIMDWVLKCYQEKLGGESLPYRGNTSKIERYSYPYLTKRVAELLQ